LRVAVKDYAKCRDNVLRLLTLPLQRITVPMMSLCLCCFSIVLVWYCCLGILLPSRGGQRGYLHDVITTAVLAI